MEAGEASVSREAGVTMLSHVEQLHLQTCRNDRAHLQAALDVYQMRRPIRAHNAKSMCQSAARFEAQIAMLTMVIEAYERELGLT